MTCNYRNCDVELGEAPTFRICDRCRILDNRERLALIVDPTSPFWPGLAAKELTSIITQMTGDEMLNMIQKWEHAYLEICKLRVSLVPQGSGRRVKISLSEAIDEAHESVERVATAARSIKKKAKTELEFAVKIDKVLWKQMKSLGCSDDCRGTAQCQHEREAKRIFNDDLGL